jgi:hypothetical protein
MRTSLLFLLLAGFLPAAPRFQVKLAPEAGSIARDGRVIVVVSKEMQGEPRFQLKWGLETQQIFGKDVNGWQPGDTVEMGADTSGAPLHSLADLPAGTYNVQAVLNVYETFHRADGHALKLHPDHGEGQQWNRSPGNLYSKPQRVEVQDSSTVRLELTETIPPIDPPKDTKYIRHLRIKSKLLTEFWGRPVFLEATVLVPRDFDEGKEQYPVAFLQSHFGGDFFAFRETPPEGNGGRRDAGGYQLYQDWTAGRLPRMLLVVTSHATPYYDDSYGVNTANAGPYGDALTKELYPAVEKQFRAIGEPWARVVFGGSTGGWMTLAQQIFYPEYFGGAWGFCPDPVDFHAFQSINVYAERSRVGNHGIFQPAGSGAGYTRTLGRPDGRLSCDVWTDRCGRIPGQAMESGKRRDRSGSGEVLARALRSDGAAGTGLGATGAKTGGQDPRHHGHQGHVLPGCRRTPHAAVSREYQAARKGTLL